MEYSEFKRRADSYIIRHYYTMLVLKDSDPAKLEQIKKELRDFGDEEQVQLYIDSYIQ